MAWEDWVRTVEVEPSIYAADFANLGEQVQYLLNAGARVFHFDVGDGHFIPPVTIGPIVLRSIAPTIHAAGGVIDCHLMVDNPEHHFAEVAASGGDTVSFHYEVCADPVAAAALAREHGLVPGLAFSPGTAVADVVRAAAAVDFVVCMSIRPGYSGQAFLHDAFDRIRELRRLLPADVPIEVDGGIGASNTALVCEAGAALLVAGNAIFAEDDPARAYRALAAAAQGAVARS